MGKLLEIWRRVRQDGGLLVMIALAVGICLLLPQGQEDTVGPPARRRRGWPPCFLPWKG